MAQTILYISTYIGSIIKTKNTIFGFFWLASKHCKYPVLRQSQGLQVQIYPSWVKHSH